MVDFDLGNGQVVPPGYKVAIDMQAAHFNPEVYPDPERCDLLRFSNLRKTEALESKYGFATVDSHVSLFQLSGQWGAIKANLYVPVSSLWCW